MTIKIAALAFSSSTVAVPSLRQVSNDTFHRRWLVRRGAIKPLQLVLQRIAECHPCQESRRQYFHRLELLLWAAARAILGLAPIPQVQNAQAKPRAQQSNRLNHRYRTFTTFPSSGRIATASTLSTNDSRTPLPLVMANREVGSPRRLKRSVRVVLDG